jgi:dynein assembly factor with WDR repeat domains 1
LSCSQFDYTGEYCVTGSIDRTCILWDVASGKPIETFRGHNDEVLDVSFSNTGNKLATASADGNGRIYNVFTGACTSILLGNRRK